MARSCGVLALCLAALAAGRAAAQGDGGVNVSVKLWTLGGAARVDPVAGAVIEPGVRPGPASIELQAARNETVEAQIVVEALGPRVDELAVSIDGLAGPAALERGTHVRLWLEWYVEVRAPSKNPDYEPRLVSSLGRRWYPDALVPLDGPDAARLAPGLGTLAIPGERNAVPGQRAQAFWLDVWVPPDAPAGTYLGEVTVSWRGGSARVPVRLEVLPITLPDDDSGAAGIGSVSYDFVGFHLAKIGPRAVQDFYRLAHAHRITLDALYLTPDWNGGEIDWARYDELVGPVLDGSAFTPAQGYYGPGQGRPVRRFNHPVDWNWPVGPDTPGYDATLQAALRAVEAHVVERGWTRTEWNLFINTLDEPRTPEAFAQIRRYGRLLKTAGLTRPELVRFRIDAGNFAAIGDVLDGWTVDRIFEEIGDEVDVWNVCGGVPFIGSKALAARRRAHPDEQAWFYASNTAGEPAIGSILIDGEALGPRTWGWILWRYGFAAGVAWEIGWPRPTCLRDATCSGFGLNGDASLVYLADELGAPGVVLPSIRLKNLRRGAEDHELLRLLAASGRRELADAYAARLVPRALDDGVAPGAPGQWDHDPAAWDAVRREVEAVLAGAAPPPAPAAVLAQAPPPRVGPEAAAGRARAIAIGAAAVLVVLVLAIAIVLRRRRSARAR